MKKQILTLLLFGSLAIACSFDKTESQKIDWETMQDSTNIAFSIKNLDGPEAVRFDPEQDVYFISNFTGGGNDRDSAGFIARADNKGTIIERNFMTGTEQAPLHAPRGMFIVGKTLWAADVLGLHGFNKETGQQTDFIDFGEFEIGFLNDVSADLNGHVYVTDTGSSRVYKVENGKPEIYLDSLPHAPNGITLIPESNAFVLAPWGGGQTFHSFNNTQNLTEYGNLNGGFFDGLEFLESKLLVASQQDSSIRVFDGDSDYILIKTPGRPADIGINTKLNHIAVPYIALDRVDIWKLSNN